MENRPSKKQRELLSFIDGFIKGNGYGPSYREIMRALNYRSVSTVAVHVDGLIQRGLLRKKDNSARSLEVVASNTPAADNEPKDTSHITWLSREIKRREAQKSAVAQEEARLLAAALAILQKQPEGAPNVSLDQTSN